MATVTKDLTGVTSGTQYASAGNNTIYTNLPFNTAGTTTTNVTFIVGASASVDIIYNQNYKVDSTQGFHELFGNIEVQGVSTDYNVSSWFGKVVLTHKTTGQVIQFQLTKPENPASNSGVNVEFQDGAIAFTSNVNQAGVWTVWGTTGGTDTSTWGQGGNGKQIPATYDVAVWQASGGNTLVVNPAGPLSLSNAAQGGWLNYDVNSTDVTNWTGTVPPLTTQADNVVGSGNDDYIDGSLTAQGLQTFQTWDSINGGTGNDTLFAELGAGVVVTPTLSSLENISLQQAGQGAGITTLNTSGLVGTNNITLNANGAAGGGFAVNNLGSVPTNITITNSSAAVNTINFDAPALLGANTVSVTLSAVSNTAGANGLTISDNGSNALETINLTATGGASSLTALTATGLGATTLNLAGSSNLTLAVVDGGATLRTINGSTATGALTVTAIANSTVTGGSGSDTLTSGGPGTDNFTGGLGNDTFVFTGALNNTDTITGGDGTDALRANAAELAGAYTNITSIETLQVADALAGQNIVGANVASSVNSVALRAGGNGGITLPAGTGTVSIGTIGGGVLNGQLTISDTGTATSDVLNLNNSATLAGAALNAYAGQAIVVNGYETVNLSTGSSTGAANTVGAVTLTPDAAGTSTLNISGSNGLTAGVISANAINASGLTGPAALTMTAGANTATSITGSAGNDVLIANQNASTYITGGNGNDSLTGGQGNDSLLGGDGNDLITVNNQTGGVLVNAGTGNDTVSIAGAGVQATDTIIGGEGSDSLLITAVAANITATNAAGISGFENLEVQGAATVALDMSGFVNNTFTQINVDNTVANVLTLNNVSSSVTTLGLLTNGAATSAGDSTVFARQIDLTNNALTIKNTDGGNYSGANAVVAITANDEETITINTTGVNAQGVQQDGNVTVTTLTAGDLTTLNVQGAANVALTTIAGATSLATVNATGLSGNFTANAGSSTVNLTFTAGTGGAIFTSGSGSDMLTGSALADTLNGGIGADTIVGNGGNDSITGGAGADQVTAGAGTDTMVQGITDSVAASAVTPATAGGLTVTAGASLSYANGVDVITDFLAGATGDVLSLQLGGVPVSLLNQAIAGVLAAGSTGLLSGTWNAATKTFTVSADGAGPDTIIYQGNGALAFNASTSAVVLQGVNSANLNVNNFGGAVPGTISGIMAGTVLNFTGNFTVGTLAFDATTGAVTVAGGPTLATPTPPTGYAAATVTSINFSAITPVPNTVGAVSVTLGTSAQNAALTSVIGTAGADRFTVANPTLFTAANTLTVNGGNGSDTLVLTNADTAGNSNIVAAQLVSVENISLTNGTVDTAATTRVLTLNNAGLVVTNASATAAASVTFAVGTTGSSFNTGSNGVQTIIISDTSTSVTTGAGADVFTVNGGANFATTTIVGAGGVDTLTIAPGAVGATTYTIDGVRISGIDTLVFDAANNAGAQTLTVTDAGVTTLAIADAAGATATATNATVAATTGFTYSNADATVGALTFANTYNGLFTIAAAGLGAAHTITFSGNADAVNMTSANLAVAAAAGAPISGGVGVDTLTMTTAATAVTDLNAVRSFETINLSGGAQALTPADAVGGAGVTTTINAAALTGNLTLSLTNEADGSYNVIGTNVGAGAAGDTVTGGALADTISGGVGRDSFLIRAGANGNDTWTGGADNDQFVLTSGANTVATSGIINITDFKAAGAGSDQIQLDMAAGAAVAAPAGIANIAANTVGIVQAALTTSQITTQVTGAAAANAFAVIFNSSTGVGEVWFDTDWADVGNRSQVATLSNVTTVGGVTGLAAGDFNLT